MKKACIAMSGGVDSSVAAYLMKQAGFACTGVTMKLYENETIGLSRTQTCCSLDDTEDARSVAVQLGFPYYVFNFKAQFENAVIRKFVHTYQTGGTPNPCIDCNRFLKFDALWERANLLGMDCIVTGHYARIVYDPYKGRYLLKKGLDASKDQSYVLYTLTQEQLSYTYFPLGIYEKREIRTIAEAQGFATAQKPDSQDICFAPDGDYAEFIERYCGAASADGDFVGTDGRTLGKHRGIIRYTIGQRKGLHLALPHPLYVCSKCVETNRVILGAEENLYTNYLDAEDINLISVEKIEQPMRVKVCVRYHQLGQWATATQPEANRLHLVFDEPQRAITKGQAVVLYEDDTVVGGGTIL